VGQNNLEKLYLKKKKVLLIFVKIVEHWKPFGYYYKCATEDLFFNCWKFQFETFETCLLK
jgi:hypothetical protein